MSIVENNSSKVILNNNNSFIGKAFKFEPKYNSINVSCLYGGVSGRLTVFHSNDGITYNDYGDVFNFTTNDVFQEVTLRGLFFYIKWDNLSGSNYTSFNLLTKMKEQPLMTAGDVNVSSVLIKGIDGTTERPVVVNSAGKLDIVGSVSVGNFPATQPISGSVSVSNFPSTQPISGSVNVGNFPATQAVSGAVSVSNFPSTQDVSVSNFPATQPVSGSVSVSNFPATQPVSGSVSVSNFPATQPVSGSVNVGNFPATQTVSGSVNVGNFPSTQAVSGAVSVSNFPSTQDVSVSNFPATQPISGSVSVSNFPATQTVSGSVNVGNFPATQPVSGSVNVGNFPATQPVSGSVSVSNFPATQPVSGTVSANVTNSSIDVHCYASSNSTTWHHLKSDANGVLNVHSALQDGAGTDLTSTLNGAKQSLDVNVSNFPATQPVSGSVSVSNFPATQPVSGSVSANITNSSIPVTGTFFQTTQPVSGSVSANITNSSIPVSGAIKITDAGGVNTIDVSTLTGGEGSIINKNGLYTNSALYCVDRSTNNTEPIHLTNVPSTSGGSDRAVNTYLLNEKSNGNGDIRTGLNVYTIPIKYKSYVWSGYGLTANGMMGFNGSAMTLHSGSLSFGAKYPYMFCSVAKTIKYDYVDNSGALIEGATFSLPANTWTSVPTNSVSPAVNQCMAIMNFIETSATFNLENCVLSYGSGSTNNAMGAITQLNYYNGYLYIPNGYIGTIKNFYFYGNTSSVFNVYKRNATQFNFSKSLFQGAGFSNSIIVQPFTLGEILYPGDSIFVVRTTTATESFFYATVVLEPY